MKNTKLSIVIVCWNDFELIKDAIDSILEHTRRTDYEVIVSDNGSEDGSPEKIRMRYAGKPVRVIENMDNLGFARGNNVGIHASTGEYVLLLNPDTLITTGALDTWMEFVDKNSDAGAFGCRILYGDMTYQISARPFPTVRGYWLAAFCMRWLGRFSSTLLSDIYPGWVGDSVRDIDWQSGCCVMFRRDLLMELKGLDPRFFYHFEEVDLCYRVHQAGYRIAFDPESVVVHLCGQSVKRERIRFEIETLRNRLRYFEKHYGMAGAESCRRATIAYYRLRRIGYSLLSAIWPREVYKIKHEIFTLAERWITMLNPGEFLTNGTEAFNDFDPLISHAKLQEIVAVYEREGIGDT